MKLDPRESAATASARATRSTAPQLDIFAHARLLVKASCEDGEEGDVLGTSLGCCHL